VEVEMLDKDEREALREIERQITAADPDLAALLRGERSVARAATRTCLRVAFALLVLLVVVLLVLGLPGSALAVAAVAAGLWWKWGHHVTRPWRRGRRHRPDSV
jgi:Flp pilus assembly protein TadB